MDVLWTLDAVELAWAGLAILVAGILYGYTGFGAALIATPLLSLIYEPVQAVALTAIVGAVGAVQLSWNAVDKAAWPDLWPVVAGIVIATPIGAHFLIVMDPEVVRRLIGLFVLLATIGLASGWTYRGPRGLAAGAAAGVVGGGISGAAGVGGPAVVVYFMAAPLPVPTQRANIVLAVSAMILAVLVSLIAGGAMKPKIVATGIVLIAPYAAGTWSGNRLFNLAPDRVYRWAALCLLFVASLAALIF